MANWVSGSADVSAIVMEIDTNNLLLENYLLKQLKKMEINYKSSRNPGTWLLLLFKIIFLLEKTNKIE